MNCVRIAVVALFVWLAGYSSAAASSQLSAEQASILEEVRTYALQYSNKLPDYICTQTTQRNTFRLPTSAPALASAIERLPNPDRRTPPSRDVIEEKLSYVGRRESYEVIAINGGPAYGAKHLQLAGAVSAGEFGSLMRHLFMPTTKTTFSWKQMANLRERSVYVFAYSVPAEAGTHVKAAIENREIVARYDGLIYIDTVTKVISRITVGVHLPLNFSIRLIRQIVEYAPVTIAAASYSLPSHAEVRIQDDLNEYANKIDFKNYHRFGTESTLLVGNLSSGPETKTPDGQNSSQAAIAQPSAAEPVGEIAEAHSELTGTSKVADSQVAEPVATGPVEKILQSPPAKQLRLDFADSPAISLPQPIQPAVEKAVLPAAVADAPKEPFRLRVSADLVIVPVVVRNREGQAVGNLTREDFQLFDKGKRREITSFTVEVQEGNAAEDGHAGSTVQVADGKASGVSALPEFTLFLFDDRNLKAGDLMEVKEAAARQLDRMRPTDRVAILTTSDVEISGFTANREALRDALKKIRLQPQGGPMALHCPQVTYYMADLMLNGSEPALQVAIAEAGQCLFDKGQARRRALSAAREAAMLGEQASRSALQTMKNAVHWISQMPGKRSIILVSPGFYLGRTLQVEAAYVVDEAIRAEVVMNSLDARGLYTINAGGETAGGLGSPTAMTFKFEFLRDEAALATNVMEEMAAGTGGNFVHNTNDLVGGFRQLATPPTCNYLLGFKPENVKMDGSFHALKVQLNAKKKLNLQARRGYFAVKP